MLEMQEGFIHDGRHGGLCKAHDSDGDLLLHLHKKNADARSGSRIPDLVLCCSRYSHPLHLILLVFSGDQAHNDAPRYPQSRSGLLHQPASRTLLCIVFVTIDRPHVEG